MDHLILSGKLEFLRRCIKRIEDKKPTDVDHLIQDPDLQDILVLNLARSVQLSVDIGSHIISDTDETAPQTMGEVFYNTQYKIGAICQKACEQLKKAVGFRNIAVHNYETINWENVYTICEQFLDDFHRKSA